MFPAMDGYGLVVEVVRVAYSIKAGDGTHYNHVPSSAHQGRSRTYTELVYLVVDAQVLFYIGVSGGNIGLRLVVVIIGDKIFYGILRKKGLEFSIKLGRKSFVVAQDQGRSLQFLDNICHGKCFSGTCNTKEGYIRNSLT